jgi:hypothetical protein
MSVREIEAHPVGRGRSRTSRHVGIFLFSPLSFFNPPRHLCCFTPSITLSLNLFNRLRLHYACVVWTVIPDDLPRALLELVQQRRAVAGGGKHCVTWSVSTVAAGVAYRTTRAS